MEMGELVKACLQPCSLLPHYFTPGVALSEALLPSAVSQIRSPQEHGQLLPVWFLNDRPLALIVTPRLDYGRRAAP